MPRPREFEPQEALHEAMLLFWRQGYLDTSMDELVKATGVSRYGLYNTFGDKQELFIKALDYYSGVVINMLIGPLERPQAGLAEIHGYFNALLSMTDGERWPLGCLIGNTAVALTPTEAEVSSRIINHYARMRLAFLNALENGQSRGEISAALDAEAYADFLIGIANGFLVSVQAGLPEEALQHFMAVALAELQEG